MSSMFTPVISATMTSLEIAELTGKRHDHVMRDIRLMLAELHGDGGVPSFGDTHRNPQNGQEYPVFRLPRREVEILVTGYSITLRAKVIDRLRELESEVARPRELSRLELIQMALAAEQEKIRIEAERDHAIATKAQIGSKREASAMATASAAVREVNRLKGELGKNSKHATVIAVERATGKRFPKNAYVALRRWCKRNSAQAVDVVDERYGSVKAWPAGAWLEAFDICLEKLFPA
ncbi:Rha family transcriptional regulator [Pseudomonas sp. o96-267]|uniref:Rha family transcriptional regulator n=1 Tax=Pseudomonas sp. o96-267 TaxID=2479853 RepID=UPI00131A41F6|nr:Rha family transcriptional regulator [Pseudomonas sp. o96-267]